MKFLVGMLSCFALFNAQSIALSNPIEKPKTPAKKALKNVNTFELTKRGAAKQVKQRYPGKVLNVKDSQQFYRVRMLQAQGKVVDYRVNKSNGLINKDIKKNAHSDN